MQSNVNRLVLPLAGLSLAPALAVAQVSAAPAGCNNLNRTISESQGVIGTPVETQCGGFTIFEVTLPLITCDKEYSYRQETLWTCGPAATGLHCNPRDHRSNWKHYKGNPCPGVPGSLDELMTLLSNGGWSCQDIPEIDSGFDYSAATVGCKQVQPHALGIEAAQRSGATEPFLWGGDVVTFLNGFTEESPWTALLATMADSIRADCPQNRLQSVREVTPALAGMTAFELSMQVSFEGEHNPHNDVDVRGALAADGRYAISTVEKVSDPDTGELVNSVYLQSFDGSSFFRGHSDAPTFECFVGLEQRAPRMAESAYYMQYANLWLSDPYSIERAAGTSYAVTPQADGSTRVEASSPIAPVGAGLEAYIVREVNGVPAIVRAERYRDDGSLARVMTFSKHAEIAPGTWRPLVVECATYWDAQTAPATEWRMTYSAVEVGEVSELEMVAPTDGQWRIHL